VQEKNLYIKAYKSSPIEVEISFVSRSKLKDADHAENTFTEYLMKFGLAFANLENATVRLNALELDNVFGSSEEISQHFKDHYVQLIKGNFFRLIG